MRIKATNIKHDVDYGEDGVDLPKELTFEINPDNFEDDDEIEQWLSDAISDKTNYCHDGFSWEKIAE